MLAQLIALHDELQSLLADLAQATSAPVPDRAALAQLRWRLSRASRARTRLIDVEIYPALLRTADVTAQAALTALRDSNAALLAGSREHVRDWTTERVFAEWDEYRAASAKVRDRMRARIQAEQKLLYPMLRALGAGSATDVASNRVA